MQAADIVRTGALELGSLPSKEQLTPDKYEQVVKDTQDKIQKLTDKYVKIIDEISVEKEKEVMTV